MPSVAVATDSTNYLPRARADREEIHQVSLYVGWQGQPERELEMDGFDAFYERLRRDPELPTTSQPSIGDFLAVWEPLLEEGRDIVSVHLAGGISGTCEAARQAHGLLSRARPRRARRGDRRGNRLRRGGPAGARRGRRRPLGRRHCRRCRARARDAQGAAHLVLPRHARVPAPRRTRRQSPGLARGHAEDQADPLARVRDHARRARAHGRPRVRAHGQVRAGTPRLQAPTAGSCSTSRRPSRPSA